MKHLYLTLIMLLGLSACKGSVEQRQEVAEARQWGHVQALEFADSFRRDTLELETMLIDVRSREATLRRHGHHKVADEFLDAFLSTLDSVNPSLADTIRLAQQQEREQKEE